MKPWSCLHGGSVCEMKSTALIDGCQDGAAGELELSTSSDLGSVMIIAGDETVVEVSAGMVLMPWIE